MRRLYQSVFPKVNSRLSPCILKKWTSTDPTFHLTFLSQTRNGHIWWKRTSKNFSVFHLNLLLPLCQFVKVTLLKLPCWITLCWKLFSLWSKKKKRREKIKKSFVIISPVGQIWLCSHMGKSSNVVLTRSHRKGTSWSVWGGLSAGILNPGVKWAVSVMYDVEGTEGWHPGLGNVCRKHAWILPLSHTSVPFTCMKAVSLGNFSPVQILC